ncbi:DUF4331 family protein [Enhygromyxa salina]|uniref:DUF4331 domain-containing protein n=1 Tax=Enhygromyxa salina TaxID=215803 RepID=A0A2S9YY70_9BACT|nr:DUF4331 family protein [Enhygromyxa salina]PRQ10027.1 hypothetical protein ENSA7_02330 [Enhygromyxa salina]
MPFCDALPDMCVGEGGTDTGEEATSGSDTTVAGDGDGDPTGDGDGDPTGDGDGDSPDPIVYADNAAEDYTRVDRMGMPAINTVLITLKDEYNAADPADDGAFMVVNEITTNLLALHGALDEDLYESMRTPCAVSDCVAQAAPLIIPDTLKIDLESENTFPNGRALADPVMDVILAVILLDLLGDPGQDATTLVGVLNPTQNDVAFLDEFPYLAPPN